MMTVLNDIRPINEVVSLSFTIFPSQTKTHLVKADEGSIDSFLHYGAIQLLTAALGEKKDSWIEDALENEMEKIADRGFHDMSLPMIPASRGHKHIVEWFFEKRPCPQLIHSSVGLSPVSELPTNELTSRLKVI